MARRHVDLAPVTPLALRRDEAAAALGISVETFDIHVRPHVPACRLGSVTTYPVTGLRAYVEHHATTPMHDVNISRDKRAA